MVYLEYTFSDFTVTVAGSLFIYVYVYVDYALKNLTDANFYP